MFANLNMFVIAWMFVILIGAWVLISVLIDLGAPRFRRWVTEHWRPHRSALGGTTPDSRLKQ